LSNGKASRRKDTADVLRDINKQKRNFNAASRRTSSGTGPVSFGAVSSNFGVSVGSNNDIKFFDGLSVSGGVMMGPIAYNPQERTLVSDQLTLTDTTGIINPGSSWTVVSGQSASADNLVTINGAAFSGQILYLQAKNQAITLKTTGNIHTNDNADVVLSAFNSGAGTGGEVATLIYDDKVTGGNWVVVNVGAGGGSSGAGLGDNNVWTGTNEFQNTVTVKDASFGIRDQLDNTKVANFECSGISSGTTRIYTLPNASTSLAGLGVTSQTWTGTNGFAGITNINGTATFDTLATYSGTVPIKLQGDGNNTTQTVTEIGKYGAHGVKIIAEILGDTGRSMTNPDGGSDIPVPGTNEPALSIKGAMIMNTYTMYDLDTLVFSQGVSSTTPPPENDWVYIEANTGTSGSANLTGMTYNVPTSKTHQFKVNGSLKISIDDDIDFEIGSTLEIYNTIATPSSLSTGSATALPSAPTAYFKVHYNGADRYIPYYT